MNERLILEVSNPEQRQRWLEVWDSWPDRETAGHPSYAELFAAEEDRVMAAVLRSPNGHVLFPFIMRPLEDCPWGLERTYDAVTPYGYGGPFAWAATDRHTLAEEFWPWFDDWLRGERVVSLFARLSLFEEQRLPWSEDVSENAANVVRTLDKPVDDIWMEYKHKVRKNVKRALKHNLDVEVDLSGEHLDAFLDIYVATMKRNQASESYYFPREFFEKLIRDIPGGYAFFHIKHRDKIVSTELVLLSRDHLYSFLGGTLEEAFPYRPNDLLKHAVTEWGVENNKKAFVLGGGYRHDDGIFRYKQAFAPEGTVPFVVGRRIIERTVYEKLIEQRRQWEQQQNRDWVPREDFFPTYRS